MADDSRSCLPATPLGVALRRHWIPLLPLSALDRQRARRVRLLGEDLVCYRDLAGTVGLIGDRCPHRAVSLEWGVAAEEGLRCPYHGWCFDDSGQCIDIPLEDDDFARQIKLVGYPLAALGGMLFAYLGDGTPPPLPQWRVLNEHGALCEVNFCILEHNWLDTFELVDDGVIADDVLDSLALEEVAAGSQWSEQAWGMEHLRHYEGAKTQTQLETRSRFVAPFYSYSDRQQPQLLRMRVPLDDEQTMLINYEVLGTLQRELGDEEEHVASYEVVAIDGSGTPLLDTDAGIVARHSRREKAPPFAANWMTATMASSPAALPPFSEEHELDDELASSWRRVVIAAHDGPAAESVTLLHAEASGS